MAHVQPDIPVNTLAQEDVGYIDGIVNDFNTRLAEFERLVSWMRSKDNVVKTDAVLNQEYNSLMNRAEQLQGTIDRAKEAINQLSNMVRNMTPDWLQNWLNGNTSGDHLGLVPLLIGGAVTGAIAFIGAWVSDAYIVARKIEAQENALRAGGDPTQVTESIFGPENKPTLFGFGSMGTLGLLLMAGGGFYLYQKYYAKV